MAEGQSKLPAELEWVKVVPGSQLIMKALLRYQIQQLLTQLSEFTEEESLLLMASAVNGGYSYLGSKPGKNFMASQHRLLSAFLEFCVKHSGSSDSATPAPSNPEHTSQNSRPGSRMRTPSEAVFSSIQATSSSPSSSTADTSYPSASATSSPLAISTVASEATIGSVTDQILAEGSQISPDKRSACKSRRFHPYIKSKSVNECNSNKDGDMCMQEKGAVSGLKNNPRFRVKGPYVDTFHVISIPSVCTEQTRDILDHANKLRLEAEAPKVHTISSPGPRTEQNLDTSGQESPARLSVVSVQGGLQVQKETAPDLSGSKTAPDLSLTEASPDLSSKSMSTDLPLPEVKIEVLEDLQPGAFPCNVNESETSIRPRLDSVKSDTESDTGEGISMDQGVLLLSPGAVLPLSSSAETQTQGVVETLSSSAEPETRGAVLSLSSSAEPQTPGAVTALSFSAEPQLLPQVEPHVKMEVLEDIAEITSFESSLQRTDSSDLDNIADLDLASTSRQELSGRGNNHSIFRKDGRSIITPESVDAVKTERADPAQIPTAVPRAYFRNISIWQRAVTVVAMAMETTDCIHGQEIPHITQISAEAVNTSDSFNIYVIPQKPISFEAQQMTSIVCSSGVMTVPGTVVKPVPIQTALLQFCDWLRRLPNHVILMAHNGKKFNFPVLVSAFEHNSSIDILEDCISGCVDTTTILKKAFHCAYSRVYSPVDLANRILGTAYNGLNSAVEASALKDLHNYMSASMKDFLQHSFSVKDMQTHMLNQKEKAANMPSLTTLVANGVCKTAIAENAAASGLNLSHLQLIFRKAGGDGLWNAFTEMNSMGQPRVTNCKRVLESVIPKLVKYFSEK